MNNTATYKPVKKTNLDNDVGIANSGLLIFSRNKAANDLQALDVEISEDINNNLESDNDIESEAVINTPTPEKCILINDWDKAITNGWFHTINGKNQPKDSDNASMTNIFFGVVMVDSIRIAQRVWNLDATRTFIRFKVGQTWADWKEDTVVTSIPSDLIFTYTTYELATQTTPGLLSPEDKINLDNLMLNGGNILVTGVKGNEEEEYRQGFINITSEDIGAIASSLKGEINGVAELDETGKVPLSQLPAYMNNIAEGHYINKEFFEDIGGEVKLEPESGKLYIDLDSNRIYRWSGHRYIVISSDLVLGETSLNAYRGDYGKVAYEHSQSTHARTDATKVTKSTINGNILIDDIETNVYTLPILTKYDVGLSRVDNTADDEKDVKSANIATNDTSGNQIDKTYISSLEVKDDEIVYTKGDGTIGTTPITISAYEALSVEDIDQICK